MYFVNEVFYSVQGEGTFTGTPAVFIRLQGCLCQCPWCDTKFTWKMPTPNTTALHEILEKVDAPRYATTTADEILTWLRSSYPQAPLVVITGGEPLLQPIGPLCEALEQAGYRVQIETSGTAYTDLPVSTFVTVSPKVGMPGGTEIDRRMLTRANEVKMVVGDESDLAILETLLPKIPEGTRISLQPRSTNMESTKLCIKTVLERGGTYRLSLQTHRMIHIR